MEFTVYGHEVISGSNIGMHFFATLALSEAAASDYREAFRLMDPAGEPLGRLGIYEFVLRMPEITTMIDLLNSPESLLRTCLISRKRVGFADG